MIQQEPVWSFSPRKTLTQWYGHVHLLDNHVLGQWFCLDRSSGTCFWENSFRRANTISGITDNVIVASETTNYFATIDAGCYGIDLASGNLLWTSHANGLLGILLRICDFVPGYLNSMRDSPLLVNGDQTTTSRGRILDVSTGKQIDRISRKKALELFMQNFYSPEKELYHKGFVRYHNSWIAHQLPNAGQSISELEWTKDFYNNGFHIYRLDANEKIEWEFHLKDHIEGTYYSYHFDTRYVYMIVSQEKNYHTNSHNGRTEYRPVKYFFFTLDLEQGKIVQDFPLSDSSFVTCRIEDVDTHGILISFRKNFVQSKYNNENEILRYYKKQL